METRQHSAGRHIGIDFGRNATVVSVSKGVDSPATLVGFPGISREVPGPCMGDSIPVVPSAIGFLADGSFILGEGAVSPAKSLCDATFRQLVYYICENSPVLLSAGPGRNIGYHEAGAMFLTELLKKAAGGVDTVSSRVTFTRPLSAPRHYDEWLAGLAESAGLASTTTIDFGLATVRGYGLPFEDRELYVIIDAKTDSIDVAVITPEPGTGEDSVLRTRVLGMASAEFGGLCTDSWIATDILQTRGVFLSDDRLEQVSRELRYRCQRGREALTAMDKTRVRIGDLLPGCGEHTELSVAGITEIFRDNGLFSLLDRSITRAFSAARVFGYDRAKTTAVLMTGELSLFPALRDAVCTQFNPALVRHEHALDAAVLGAVMTDTSRKIPIRADYALRFWDPVAREHRYRLLVRRGARYPSAGQVARILISAAYDGQTRLGIPLCRVTGEGSDPGAGLELIGTPGGGLRLAGPGSDCRKECRPAEVNREEPTYLPASPPAQKGVPRFELTFTVDVQGYLCLTARDLETGFLVKNAARIHRLTQ